MQRSAAWFQRRRNPDLIALRFDLTCRGFRLGTRTTGRVEIAHRRHAGSDDAVLIRNGRRVVVAHARTSGGCRPTRARNRSRVVIAHAGPTRRKEAGRARYRGRIVVAKRRRSRRALAIGVRNRRRVVVTEACHRTGHLLAGGRQVREDVDRILAARERVADDQPDAVSTRQVGEERRRGRVRPAERRRAAHRPECERPRVGDWIAVGIGRRAAVQRHDRAGRDTGLLGTGVGQRRLVGGRNLDRIGSAT